MLDMLEDWILPTYNGKHTAIALLIAEYDDC